MTLRTVRTTSIHTVRNSSFSGPSDTARVTGPFGNMSARFPLSPEWLRPVRSAGRTLGLLTVQSSKREARGRDFFAVRAHTVVRRGKSDADADRRGMAVMSITCRHGSPEAIRRSGTLSGSLEDRKLEALESFRMLPLHLLKHGSYNWAPSAA